MLPTGLNLLHLLGRIVRTALRNALESEGNYALFVNIHPLDLLDADLRDADSALAAVANRVVFEITERASLMNIDGIRQKVEPPRSRIRIAVDDLGAGYAGLNSIAMLEPEFMKLDMTLIVTLIGTREAETQASLTRTQQDMGHQ